jgi:excisionase family DNA binding protein
MMALTHSAEVRNQQASSQFDDDPVVNQHPVERLAYTIAEVQKTIGCSRSHLYRAMKKGHLRFARDGSKVMVSRQAIIDYIERGDGTSVTSTDL